MRRSETQAIEETSTITAKGQTTIPKSVRRALGVDRGGKIAFRVENGRVTVRKPKPRPAPDHDDPVVLGGFLKLLEKEIAAGKAKPLPKSLVKAMKRFRNRDIDLDTPLIGDVDW